MRVPEGTDWFEYMLNVKSTSARTLGVMNHMALGVPDVQAGYKTVLSRGLTPAEPDAAQRRQVAVEPLRPEPDEGRVNGTEAGAEALLLTDGGLRKR